MFNRESATRTDPTRTTATDVRALYHTDDELRIVAADVSITTGRTLKGYAAKWDSPSQDLGGFREIIKKGCFARSLRESPDILALWNHNVDKVLGSTAAGTLTLAEDDTGLAFTIILPNSPTGQDAYVAVNRGDVRQCSFRFAPGARDSWGRGADGTPLRTLLECKLLEISTTPIPAYLSTTVSASSSRSETPKLDAARNRLREDQCAALGILTRPRVSIATRERMLRLVSS